MSPRASDSDIAIVGGGTASLFLALQLLRSSETVTVHIIERGAENERRKQGVLVHPLTQALFEALVPSHQWQWNNQVHRFREFVGDELLSDFDAGLTDSAGVRRFPSNTHLGLLDQPILRILQDRHRARLSYETQVTSIQHDDDGWVIEADTREGMSVFHSAVLIAADGRESPLRDLLGIPYEQVQFPGRVDVLALTDRRSGTPAVSMVVGSDGATTIVDNGIGDDTLIFDMRPDGQRPERPAGVRTEVRARALIAGLTIAEQAQPFFSTSIRSSTVSCGTWLTEDAIVFGDAAHAMHNLGGQGFNLAIQDAGALTPGLLSLLSGDDSSLRHFEDFRLPFITDLQIRQNRLFDGLTRDARPHLNEGGWLAPLQNDLTRGQAGLDAFLPMIGATRHA